MPVAFNLTLMPDLITTPNTPDKTYNMPEETDAQLPKHEDVALHPPGSPAHRADRVNKACSVLSNDAARDAFRKIAAALPECGVFWGTEHADQYAELSCDAFTLQMET